MKPVQGKLHGRQCAHAARGRAVGHSCTRTPAAPTPGSAGPAGKEAGSEPGSGCRHCALAPRLEMGLGTSRPHADGDSLTL